MERPNWCPHSECKFKVQSQDKMCVGQLPEPTDHDGGTNTHRLCMDTTETGHGIFDLQLNWGDCWNLIRLLQSERAGIKPEARGVVENFAHEPNKEPLTEALNKHNVLSSCHTIN